MSDENFSSDHDPAQGQRDEHVETGHTGQSRQLGRYSLAEILLEIKLDADGVAGGSLLDQRRIDSIFRKEEEL